jgi:hypothetical protein
VVICIALCVALRCVMRCVACVALRCVMLALRSCYGSGEVLKRQRIACAQMFGRV